MVPLELLVTESGFRSFWGMEERKQPEGRAGTRGHSGWGVCVRESQLLRLWGDGSCSTCCGSGFLTPTAAVVSGSCLSFALLQIPPLPLETLAVVGFRGGACAEGFWWHFRVAGVEQPG